MTALWVSFVGVPDWLRSEIEVIEQPVVIELVAVAEETRAARPKSEPVKANKPPPNPRQKPKPPSRAETPPPAPSEPDEEVAVIVPDIKPAPEPKKKPIAKPKRKPKPPERAVKQPDKMAKKSLKKKYRFDPSRIAALIDKTPRKKTAQEPVEEPQMRQKIVSQTAQPFDGQPLTLSEVDALRAQVERCWIVQAGARYAEDLVVTIRIYLNPDGSLRREPQVVDEDRLVADPFFRAAAESAVWAVLKCEPFKMPVAKYHRWREIELTFDPRKLLG